jgi:hypothetical protein
MNSQIADWQHILHLSVSAASIKVSSTMFPQFFISHHHSTWQSIEITFERWEAVNSIISIIRKVTFSM